MSKNKEGPQTARLKVGIAMNRKSIGWTALSICLAAVSLTSFGGKEESPQSAQAATPSPERIAIPAQTAQACQAVTDQLLIIHRVNVAEVNAKAQQPLAALDELVSLQSRIDKSACPADFRLALVRFIAAENAARIHARLNKSGLSDAFFAAGVECIAADGLSAFRNTKPPNAASPIILQREKQDFAAIQSTFLDFARIAIKYGVK
jgi:hypothetical protein